LDRVSDQNASTDPPTLARRLGEKPRVARCASGALLDEVAHGGRFEAGAETKQGVEGCGGVAPSVPADFKPGRRRRSNGPVGRFKGEEGPEGEFVEVAIEVLAAQAVEGAERPTLQVREHAVGPAQNDMGGHLADDFWLMGMVGHADVAGPAVGDDTGAGRGRGGDEGLEGCCGEIRDRCETDAAGLAVWRERHRIGDDHLAQRAAALRDTVGATPVSTAGCRFCTRPKAFSAPARFRALANCTPQGFIGVARRRWVGRARQPSMNGFPTSNGSGCQ